MGSQASESRNRQITKPRHNDVNPGWFECTSFAFGRNRGKPLRDVAESDPDYLNWLLTCDFAPDARSLIEGALRGEFPRC